MMDWLPHVIAAISSIDPGELPHTPANEQRLELIKNIVYGIVGAIALLIITVSGLHYMTSAGDPEKAARAKNGIVFSLAGVAIALAATAIISFVIDKIT
jgi:hypothetical protein